MHAERRAAGALKVDLFTVLFAECACVQQIAHMQS